MNVVLIMFKDGERRDFPVTESKTILGRREDCHLRIPTRDVSRQHCALLLDNGKKKLTAKDLGSANGTFINGKRIAEAELKAGDRLRLGPVTFVVQIDGKPAKVKPDDVGPTKPAAAPAVAAAGEDEETFDLTEEDFDLEDAISTLEEDQDDDDMP